MTATVIEDHGIPEYVGASPSQLRRLLATLDEEMSTHGFSHASQLNPGVDESTVRQLLEPRGLVLPDELLVWFAWANGGTPLLGGGPLSSVQQAVERYDDWQDVLAHPEPGLEDIDWGASAGFLPLFESNYGMVIDCSGASAAKPEIRMTVPEFGFEPGYRARSLCTLIAWWIEGLQAGAYSWDGRTSAWMLNKPSARPELQIRHAFS